MIRIDHHDNYIDWQLIDAVMVAMAYTTFSLNGQYIEANPLEIYCDDFDKVPGEAFGYEDWKANKMFLPF